MTYQPRHSIIGVEIDGCDFTTDTQLMPWAPRTTPDGIEMHQRCVVHGVKINGVWFDACAMGDDFIEEMEYEIQRMPLNAEGDIDEAAIRMGKAVMAKRAAEAAQPKTLDDPRLQELFSATIDGALTTGYQGGKAPPAGHWLTFWYDKGRAVAAAEAAQAQAEPVRAVPLTDADKQAIRECEAAVLPCVRKKFPAEQALAELVRRAHGITGEQHGG